MILYSSTQRRQEPNLHCARIKVPDGIFVKVEPNQSLDIFGKFDLIICNFVLVEHSYDEARRIIQQLQPLINNNGVLQLVVGLINLTNLSIARCTYGFQRT